MAMWRDWLVAAEGDVGEERTDESRRAAPEEGLVVEDSFLMTKSDPSKFCRKTAGKYVSVEILSLILNEENLLSARQNSTTSFEDQHRIPTNRAALSL